MPRFRASFLIHPDDVGRHEVPVIARLRVAPVGRLLLLKHTFDAAEAPGDREVVDVDVNRASAEVVELRLRPARLLHVLVTDVAGDPVPAALVSLAGQRFERDTRTGTDGRVALTVPEDDRVHVVVGRLDAASRLHHADGWHEPGDGELVLVLRPR